jgi:hypothetical protein
MRRVVALMLLFVGLMGATALAPSPARADDGTGVLPDLTAAGNFAAEKQSLIEWPSTPIGTGSASDLGIAGFEAESAAGLVPTLGVAGVIIGGGAAAAYTAWHVSSGIWRQVNSQEASGAVVAGWAWRKQSIFTPKNAINDAACNAYGYPGGAPCDYYTLEYSTAVANPGATGNFPNPYPSGGGSALLYYCTSSSDVHCSGASEDINARNFAAQFGALASNHTGIGTDDDYMIWDNSSNPYGLGCTSFCDQFFIIRNDMQMAKHTNTPLCDATCQTSHTTVTDTSTSFSRPTSGTSVTDTQLANALCALGIGTGCAAANGSPATTVHKTEVDILKKAVDPMYGDPAAPNCIGLTASVCASDFAAAGFTATPSSATATFTGADVTQPAATVITQSPGAGVIADPASAITYTVNPAAADMPFTIPRPYNYETYADYVARLVALGYVGTITETDLSEDTADGTVGPGGVPRIGVKLGTDISTTTVFRSAWPTVAPQAKRSAAIQIWKNPSDVAEPAPDPTDAVPNPDPGAGGGDIPAGGLDFTPLTGLEPGCRFPYGFVCYAQEVTGWFSVAAVAPVFDFTIPALHVGSTSFGGDQHYDVSLDVMSTYMGWIRDLEAVVLWIGAVYLIATRLLGFNAGGDPGEAIDAVDW